MELKRQLLFISFNNLLLFLFCLSKGEELINTSSTSQIIITVNAGTSQQILSNSYSLGINQEPDLILIKQFIT